MYNKSRLQKIVMLTQRELEILTELMIPALRKQAPSNELWDLFEKMKEVRDAE